MSSPDTKQAMNLRKQVRISLDARPHEASRPVLVAGDVVLFQGDSITNAFRLPNEINDAYQLGAGYPLLIASELLATHPKHGFRFLNRGITGNNVTALLARWKEDCIDLKPTLISILIGTADATSKSSGPTPLTEYADNYRALLSTAGESLPGVKFVVCEPFLLPVPPIVPNQLSDIAERQKIVRRIAEESGATLVPLQSALNDASLTAPPEFWAYDGMHVTAAGHRILANCWLDSVMKNGTAPQTVDHQDPDWRRL